MQQRSGYAPISEVATAGRYLLTMTVDEIIWRM